MQPQTNVTPIRSTIDAAIHDQVDRLKNAANEAMKALQWLEVEGFFPISIAVDRERRLPVIRIRHHAIKCEWLKTSHGAYTYSFGPGEETWRCDLFNCRVEWVERRVA